MQDDKASTRMTGCACVAVDAYDCWAGRYRINSAELRELVDADGGPCECACHHEDDDDDES